MVFSKTSILARSLLVMADLVTVVVATALAGATRQFLGQFFLEPLIPNISWFLAFSPLFALLLITNLWAQGLYVTHFNSWHHGPKLLKAFVMWTIWVAFFLALKKQMQEFSRIVLLLQAFYAFIISFVFRFYFFQKLLTFWGWIEPYLLLNFSSSEMSQPLLQNLNSKIVAQYYVEGNLDESQHRINIERIIDQTGARGILWLAPDKNQLVQYDLFEHLLRDYSVKMPFHLLISPHINSLVGHQDYLIFPSQMTVVSTLNSPLLSWWQALVKRLLDIILSAFLILALLPVFIIVALGIKISSPGPIIFIHRRVGKKGRLIPVLKFRSMYVDAAERLQHILNSDPEAAREWQEKQKLSHDYRIFPFGRLLRQTSLDELPQLFNVLLGHMSLVGPRPVTEEELSRFYKENRYFYESVRPGITGLWQISGRSDTTYEKRVQFDTWYVAQWSLWNDIMILLKTINVVLRREGAR